MIYSFFTFLGTLLEKHEILNKNYVIMDLSRLTGPSGLPSVVTYDKKYSSKECHFIFDIEIAWKSYPKIVSISKCFFLESRPFLGYFSNFGSIICKNL